MNSRALLAWLKPKAGRACWSRPSTTASRRVRYWLRNANGHERKGARTSGVASSSWPSMTEPLLSTLRLDKNANWATQGGRLLPAGFCVTLRLVNRSNGGVERMANSRYPLFGGRRRRSRDFTGANYDNVSTGRRRGDAARGRERDP